MSEVSIRDILLSINPLKGMGSGSEYPDLYHPYGRTRWYSFDQLWHTRNLIGHFLKDRARLPWPSALLLANSPMSMIPLSKVSTLSFPYCWSDEILTGDYIDTYCKAMIIDDELATVNTVDNPYQGWG